MTSDNNGMIMPVAPYYGNGSYGNDGMFGWGGNGFGGFGGSNSVAVSEREDQPGRIRRLWT